MGSLSTQKWTKIKNIQFEGYEFGTVLTSNERYIILLGGKNDTISEGEEVDNIFVLDMKNEDNSKWKLRKSSIKCPNVGDCHAVRTGGVDSKDDILVNGFIKDCFKKEEFENMQLPPLIAMWYSAEMIHWIQRKDTDDDSIFLHYGIYLQDI